MKTMRSFRRLLPITCPIVTLWALLGACSDDDDQTDVCLGPGCATYQGAAGRNTLTAGNLGGAGGATDAGSGPPDAGAEGGSSGAGGNDAGTPSPEPCEVAFVLPFALDGGAITLAARDDIDGEACGPSFGARVVLQSNASTINLFVNDNPLGEVSASGGIARFDAALGNRGELGNILRAEATMADGRQCSVELGGSVFVDCPGPSCSIEEPRANRDGFLNQGDDGDAADGLQTDIVVVTEADNAGHDVRLEIDDDFEAVPVASVVAEDGAGRASFPGVTLEEGVRTVRAECSDGFGLVTLSPPTEWNVDVSACSLELDGVANGADPITPDDDLDGNAANGLDVLVRGSVEGDDCEQLQIGECGDDPTDIRLSGLLDDDGSFLVPIRLAASTASVSLCARVSDAAGNESSPDVELEVSIRADSPSVAITSPAGTTRYNLAGTSGAVADANPSSQGSCEIDVVVDCSDVDVGVELLADGDTIATVPCSEQSGLDEPFRGRAAFSGVSLPSRDDGSSTTLSARQSVPGLPAGVASSVSVQADCSAPSCSFEAPNPGAPVLGEALDSSDDDGFQIDFVVSTSAPSAGQDIRLRIDGDVNGELSAPAVAVDSAASATFAAVTLSEAPHQLQAFCVDASGNEQSTLLTTWTVDLTACSTTVAVADVHDPINPDDDLDDATPGLQVSVTGQTSGACSEVRVGPCDDNSGAFTDLESNGTFALEATLPSATASGLGVCADVRDEAGNIASASVLVDVRIDAPSVEFLAPLADTLFNVDGGGCDTTAVVGCSEDGAPVALFADGALQGTSACTGGEASFLISLLSKNDGATTELTATQTAEGVTSAAASVRVQADCEPPELSIAQPVCNTELALRGDDTNPGAAGVQLDVNVVNGGVPDVILTVTRGTSTDLEASGDASSTDFTGVNLGGVGSVSLAACARDPQGNEGCAPSCPLTIVAEPSITITNPRPPAAFTIDNDCDPAAPNLQIEVDGTTDAVDGSAVEITIGTGSTLTEQVSSGRFSSCVGAPEGEDQVLTARVTDGATDLSASASVIVSINTSPPPAIGAPSFEVTGRREGTLELSWTSVLDASNDPLVAYHLRCALTDITTEADWDTATVFPVTVAPAGAAGIAETQAITNFRTGLERFCMVRGQDAYGQLSPLSGDDPTVALVSNPFLTLEYTSVTPTTVRGIRVSLAALGDINGDGEDDFAYGTQNGGVAVFFGGPDLSPTPDVTIAGPPTQSPAHEFGANVAGLGDINGDGLPDFAVSARILSHAHAPLGGTVYIFYGRSSSAEWAALAPIALSISPGCGADLCFHSSDSAAALGSAVTSTDFNGDGETDLVIGAQNRTADDSTQRVGRVYVVLGGSQLAAGGVFELGGTALNGFIINPPSTGSRNFGINVAAVGFGSDARGDLVISALGRNVGGENISAEVFSVLGRQHPGFEGLATFSAGPAFAIGSPNDFGNPMRAVGDLNADGFGDVWVSTNFDLNGVSPVYLGRSTGFSGVSLFGYTNDVVDNEWGVYVATGFHTELGRLGDLDSNGFDDVLIGSAFANDEPGTAELFYSDGTTQNRRRSAADVTFRSAGDGQMTPSFVGDIDGDGFRDIAILDSGSSLPATTLTLYY
jgi:hypothetical protein